MVTNVFGEKLKELRVNHKLSMKQLSNGISVSNSYLYDLEKGRGQPSFAVLRSIADYFHVSVDFLMGRVDTDVPSEATVKTLPGPDYITVPVFRGYMSACAGSGIFDESGEPYETETYPSWMFGTPLGREPDTVPFIVEVSGGSMEEAGICNGDMVCINPLAYVGDNDIALVVLDGQKFIKAVFWHRDGGGELRSASSYYPVKYFTEEEKRDGTFRVIGKVTYILSKPKGLPSR